MINRISKRIKRIVPQRIMNPLRDLRSGMEKCRYLTEARFPVKAQESLAFARSRKRKYIFKPSSEEENYINELKQTEFCMAPELKRIQLEKFRKLMAHAYLKVPFYREVLDQLGLKPSDFNTMEDLLKLPLVHKADIRKDPERFISQDYTGSSDTRLTRITTGGSTGTPMVHYFDHTMVAVRRSHWWRWSDFAGIDLYNDRMIYIGGDAESRYRDPSKYKGVLNPTRTKLSLTANSMSNSVTDRYIESILEFKGDYIRGFASALYHLARRMIERDIRVPLKAVLSSSDTLYQYYRTVIEEAFQCEVFDHYGQNEDTLTATECSAHHGFHINVESCIAETVNRKGEAVYNEPGFLAGTHLENYAMPLIRYITGDIGTLDKQWEPCTCGRHHQRITELVGREVESLVTPEGRRLAHLLVSKVLNQVPNAVVKLQFIQESRDLLIVKIVPAYVWDRALKNKVIEYVRKQVGNTIEIRLKMVDDIPTQENGKYRLIVSKIEDQL